jgi:hypothetical protein
LASEGEAILAKNKEETDGLRLKIDKAKKAIAALEIAPVIKPTPTPSPPPTPSPSPTPSPEVAIDQEDETEQSEEEGVEKQERAEREEELLEEELLEEELLEETPEETIDQTSEVKPTEVKPTETPLPTETPVVPLSKVRKFFISVWRFTFQVADDKNPYLLEPIPEKEQQEKIKKLKGKIDKWERRISENDKTIKLAREELSVEFVSLKGKEYEKDDFKLQLLVEMKKSSTGLGRYKSASGGIMKYDGGSYAWEIKRGRSTDISLVCAPENKLLSVIEARTCEYDAVFGTPAVCSEEHISVLTNMTIPALRKIAETLGV